MISLQFFLCVVLSTFYEHLRCRSHLNTMGTVQLWFVVRVGFHVQKMPETFSFCGTLDHSSVCFCFLCKKT